MLRRPRKVGEICQRCRRYLTSEALTYSQTSATSSTVEYDTRLLRNVFNQSRHASLPKGVSVGLFRNSYLTNPNGVKGFASNSLSRAQKLVTRILGESQDEGGSYQRQFMIRDLDRLSDIICSVVDMTEFIRYVHPDQKMVKAALEAFGRMYTFMNELNTHTGLYKVCHRNIVSRPDKAKALKEVVGDASLKIEPEEKEVAAVLLRDFEKSGINLPDRTRLKFVQISDRIVELGRLFTSDAEPAKKYVSIRKDKLTSVDPNYISMLAKSGNYVLFPTSGQLAHLGLQIIESSEIRRDLYIAMNTGTTTQISHLEEMLKARQQIADLTNYSDYASLVLSDKMAKSSQSVVNFLDHLATANKPKTARELAVLQSEKHFDVGVSQVDAWDRDFYIARAKTRQPRPNMLQNSLSSYLSTGSVIEGLSRLLQSIYGIRLMYVSPEPGEVWHSSVQRLDVVCETEGLLGTLYCDLFVRPGKASFPAQFTIRCSRVVEEEEINDELYEGALMTRAQDNTLYQLPIVALICDFSYGEGMSGTNVLSWHQVSTLFHEVGHAVHSILGRTTFHNVAGTRCAADFVELPSVLMEYFAASKHVIPLYANHFDSREPVNVPSLLQHIEGEKQFAAMETHSQITMAYLDQQYASSVLKDHAYDSTGIYHDVQREYSLFPPVPGISWQTQFGHLYNYGATYYSYLFDRAIASRVWTSLFEKDPLSREAGERYRREVLQWGGSKDPWEIVAAVLDKPSLAKGDVAAMEEVGNWGIQEPSRPK